MESFNVTAEQADKMHQLWTRHLRQARQWPGNSAIEGTFGEFVSLFLPVLFSDGGLGAQLEYPGGGGIYVCILPDGSSHS